MRFAAGLVGDAWQLARASFDFVVDGGGGGERRRDAEVGVLYPRGDVLYGCTKKGKEEKVEAEARKA